jgi:hypothetical protein
MTSTTIVQCPYCWQELEIAVDTSAGEQSYVEDCQVCCRPMLVRIEVEDGELLSASAEMENG